VASDIRTAAQALLDLLEHYLNYRAEWPATWTRLVTEAMPALREALLNEPSSAPAQGSPDMENRR
jgi:hypothetical protein